MSASKEGAIFDFIATAKPGDSTLHGGEWLTVTAVQPTPEGACYVSMGDVTARAHRGCKRWIRRTAPKRPTVSTS